PVALGAEGAAVPLVSLTGTSAGAFGDAASAGEVVAGSSAIPVFLLAIALLSLGTVEAEELHAEPLAQPGVEDVGHPPADAVVLLRETVVGTAGVVPFLEPSLVPLPPVSLALPGHYSLRWL